MQQIPLEFKDWRDDRIEELEAKVTELEEELEDLQIDYENAANDRDDYYMALDVIRNEIRNVI